MNEESATLRIGAALLMLAIGGTFCWLAKKVPAMRGYYFAKAAGYISLGIGLAAGEWLEEPSLWLLGAAFITWVAADIFLIDRRRAAWFFFLKLFFLGCWVAATVAAKLLDDYLPIYSPVWLVLLAGASLFMLLNIFRPKDAYLSADPAST